MKTAYLIWKDPACNGVDPDWLEISGQDFFALVRSAQGKNRRFVKLTSTDNDGGDGIIVMETTGADYTDWKREKNHAEYLRNIGRDVAVVSYHAMESNDGECCGEELFPDCNSDFEPQYIMTQAFEIALASLSDEERHLIEHFYLSDKPGTVRAYEELTGIPKSSVNRRQKAILEKLKKFYEG